MTNQDVIYLYLENCNTPKLPQGFTKIFPNLLALWIENSNLKQLTKNDLAEYKSIGVFVFIKNDIEFLAGNLFEDFENLVVISFTDNKLKTIEPNILDGLNKLSYVGLRSNTNYNIQFSSTGAARTDYLTMQELKDELFKKFFDSESPEIKNFVQKLQTSIEQLKSSNKKLREKVQNLEESEKDLKAELKKWNERKNLLADIQNFIDNQKYRDLQIQISDREFKVHKFLFAARSPTLADKFLENPEAENLNLPDIAVDTFEDILHFIYTDELPSDENTDFVKLYGAASMLKINLLIDFVAPKVMENINQKNAVEVLILSNKFKNYEMRQKAFEEIKKVNPDLSDNWIDKPEKVKKFIQVFGGN
ncbi:hypothetical protein ACKWTF_014384 [Chironomus riparius]